MKNIVLKLSSLLLGETYDDLKRETTKSKQKVMLYGTLLIMIMLLWFINGYLITNQILNYPNKQAIIVGIISAFIVYTIELTIIRMSKVSILSTIIRLLMALIIAFIGSLSIDEIIFKADIENQLKINSQKETLSIPSVIISKNKIKSLDTQLKQLNISSSSLRDQMILESKTGYGPKTKLIERQLEDIINKSNLLQLESKKLSEFQKSELSSADSKTGIIKNLQAFINFNNNNIIGWFIWGVFFLFFLFIELMCLIYKFSSDITSFERKKENIDSFEPIKFNKLQDFIDNDSKRSLNSYYSSIR